MKIQNRTVHYIPHEAKQAVVMLSVHFKQLSCNFKRSVEVVITEIDPM